MRLSDYVEYVPTLDAEWQAQQCLKHEARTFLLHAAARREPFQVELDDLETFPVEWLSEMSVGLAKLACEHAIHIRYSGGDASLRERFIADLIECYRG